MPDIPGCHLKVAYGPDLRWARQQVCRHHYLHAAPDPRSRPFACLVMLGSERVGCLFFARPESTCCYQGGLTYGSGDDVRLGRARFDRWEVLNLSRVWLHPDVQTGGRLCVPGRVPGFTDRRGVFRSTLGSQVLALSLAHVGCDYLLAHPPVFLEQPYEIRVVLSYCDTRRHPGTLYRASGFQRARVNDDGVETWYTEAVARLSYAEHAALRLASQRCPRASRLRTQAANKPDTLPFL